MQSPDMIESLRIRERIRDTQNEVKEQEGLRPTSHPSLFYRYVKRKTLQNVHILRVIRGIRRFFALRSDFYCILCSLFLCNNSIDYCELLKIITYFFTKFLQKLPSIVKNMQIFCEKYFFRL